MAKRMCELCQENYESDMRFGVHLCADCIEGYSKSVRGDKDAITRFSNSQNFPMATDAALENIVEVIAKRSGKLNDALQKNANQANGEPKQDTQVRITENKRSIKTYTFTLDNVTAIKTITASTTYGIGLLTSIAMCFCNLFGVKCNMYAEKLNRAEIAATEELIEKAKRLGADGVMDIHCQVDNLTFLIYGTAYKEYANH